ncbi:hypothetical protein, partial [Yanghanlia caeni]|nr:hypothetical protein [Alcaligenaceae bacterium LG-2]
SESWYDAGLSKRVVAVAGAQTAPAGGSGRRLRFFFPLLDTPKKLLHNLVSLLLAQLASCKKNRIPPGGSVARQGALTGTMLFNN